MYSVYNTMGSLMFIWYACIRWTMFADKTKYSWAYTPINLTTAFLSILFLVISLFTPEQSYFKIMYWLGIFLLSRNIYYTLEDIIDYPTNPKTQAFYIAIDILMAMYVSMWILKYKGFLE